MTTHYHSDTERIAALRSNDSAAHVAIFEELSAAASLTDDDWKGADKAYILTAAFGSLKKAVQSDKFDTNTVLLPFFDKIARNLAAVDIVRTGEEPASSRLLRSLYLDKMVINTVKSKISGSPDLHAQSIVDEAFTRLFEQIADGKYGGRSELRTFFISICENVIREQYNKGKIQVKNPTEGGPQKVIKEVLVEEYDSGDVNPISVTSWGQTADPLELGERKELIAAVLATKEMKDCAEILRLRYFEEKSNAEAAAVLNMKEQSANNKADRCREYMRKILEAMPEMHDYIERFFRKKGKK